jgi:glycine cleavage system H protein
MSVILALTTALLLIGWGVIRSRKPQKAAAPVLVHRYVHAGHAWLRMTEDGDVLVGIDDFAQSVIGTVDEIRLPRMLGRVRQGKTGWFVCHGKRVVPIVSPVTGRVIQKNEMVLHNPTLLNTSPYGDGWLLRIRPSKLSPQLSNLFTGRLAMQWQDLARAQLARMFSGTPALMFQDGGVVLRDLADRCSDAEWSAIEREVFLAGDAE